MPQDQAAPIWFVGVVMQKHTRQFYPVCVFNNAPHLFDEDCYNHRPVGVVNVRFGDIHLFADLHPFFEPMHRRMRSVFFAVAFAVFVGSHRRRQAPVDFFVQSVQQNGLKLISL